MLSVLIAQDSGLDRSFIERVAQSASHRYRVYPIEKRTGGQRIIQHPSRQLKFLQRWLVDHVFTCLPIHAAATAYKDGASVRKNAAIHVKNSYLLKLDFENFFHSIKKGDVERLVQVNRDKVPLEFDDRDVSLISKIVTRYDALVIGAPSSPMISNQVMYEFDGIVYQYCVERGVAYSRYADDLCFSTRQPNVLFEVHEMVKSLISDLAYPKLSLNQKKTSHSSKKRKRLVTGVSLTSDDKISLGRDKKRMVRSLVHRFSVGQIELEERCYLAGYLSYAKSVEPIFIERLVTKFGQGIVAAAMKMAD